MQNMGKGFSHRTLFYYSTTFQWSTEPISQEQEAGKWAQHGS